MCNVPLCLVCLAWSLVSSQQLIWFCIENTAAVFGICDLLALMIHPPMFELLLNSACTLSRLSLFPAQTSPNSGLGAGQEVGRGLIRTDETNWPMGYFLPLTSFCSKKWRQRRKQQCGENERCWLPRWLFLRDWLGIGQLVGDDEWFLLRCLLFPLFPSPLNHLYWPMSFLIFVLPVFSPVLLGMGRHWSGCLAAG